MNGSLVICLLLLFSMLPGCSLHYFSNFSLMLDRNMVILFKLMDLT